MKAIWFTAPYKTEIVEIQKPTVEPGKVLVKLVISTISPGTERADLVGMLNISQTLSKCRDDYWPRTEGYASSGIVEEVGKGVTSVKPGDRVAMSWSKHQEYCCIPEKNVHKIEDHMTFEEASLWQIGTFPLAAIRKCHLEIGESAVVMGQGILGQFSIIFLKLAGAVPIIAVDPIPEKRVRAVKIGADYAFDPYEEEFTEQVKAVTGGGANVGIEVTGIGKGLDQILDCMARFGRVALLGCTRNSDFTINYYHKVHGPGITLIGAHTYARPKEESSPGWWTENDDISTQMKLYSFGRLKLSSLVEETHNVNEAVKVYGRLCTEKSFPLVQFDWWL